MSAEPPDWLKSTAPDPSAQVQPLTLAADRYEVLMSGKLRYILDSFS